MIFHNIPKDSSLRNGDNGAFVHGESKATWLTVSDVIRSSGPVRAEKREGKKKGIREERKFIRLRAPRRCLAFHRHANHGSSEEVPSRAWDSFYRARGSNGRWLVHRVGRPREEEGFRVPQLFPTVPRTFARHTWLIYIAHVDHVRLGHYH